MTFVGRHIPIFSLDLLLGMFGERNGSFMLEFGKLDKGGMMMGIENTVLCFEGKFGSELE